MQRSKEDKAIVEYLLGQAGESEQTRIETAYFHDPEYHEQMLALEDELIHDYLNDRLSGKERGLFEQHFLASHRRRGKHEFTKRLAEYANDSAPKAVQIKSESTASWWSWLLPVQPRLAWAAFGGAVVLCGSVWLALNSNSTPPSSGQTSQVGNIAEQRSPSSLESQSPVPLPSPQQVEAPKTQSSNGVKRVAPQSSQQRVFTFGLGLPPGTRDGIEADNTPVIRIPAGYDAVQLLVPVNDHPIYDTYDASIMTLEGVKIASLKHLTARTGSVGVVVPVTILAKDLPQADLVLTMNGTLKSGQRGSLGDTFFKVTRD